jgi:N-hydroxyarylamine O-acetyltransferase
VLKEYLERIRFDGPVCADLKTLGALQRAHTHAIPFENLDVQLGRPVSIALEPSFDKLVRRRRGGWCFEMNRVFGWALQEIGFDVTRLSAGVHRIRIGDFQLGNHLCLRVMLDQPYLVDVGFGGSLTGPMPLRAGDRDDPPYQLNLSETPDGFWRFTETAHGDPATFDFKNEIADEARFEAKCQYLQTSKDSGFVQSLVVQRRAGDSHLTLRGRVLSIAHPTHLEKSLLHSADELVETLRTRFDLDVPEAATLWPRIVAKHEELFGPA